MITLQRDLLLLLFAIASSTSAFPVGGPPLSPRTNVERPVPARRVVAVARRMGIFDDFFQSLDDFVDDAMDRKLAGGSTFFGERKSSFSETSKSYRSVVAASEEEAAAQRDEDDDDDAKNPSQRRRRRRLSGGRVDGAQLRQAVYDRWGERFPVLIKRRRDALGEQRLYLVVQWKRLGKANLNLTEEEYVAESDAVAELLTEWGVANQVRNAISESTARPKTATQQFPGLFVPLDVERSVVETW